MQTPNAYLPGTTTGPNSATITIPGTPGSSTSGVSTSPYFYTVPQPKTDQEYLQVLQLQLDVVCKFRAGMLNVASSYVFILNAFRWYSNNNNFTSTPGDLSVDKVYTILGIRLLKQDIVAAELLGGLEAWWDKGNRPTSWWDTLPQYEERLRNEGTI